MIGERCKTMNAEAMIGVFDLPEGKKTAVPFGNGHINDTFLVTADGAQGFNRNFTQAINGIGICMI